MKRICIYVFLIILLTSSFAYAKGPISVNFGLMPGGFIIAPDADGFQASRSGSFSTSTSTVSGSVAYTPGAFIGLDVDSGNSGFGVDVFGNTIISPAITGSIYGANLSYIFPHDDDSKFNARVKVGAVAGSIDWESDINTVMFDDASGWQAGLGMEVGRTVKFCAELLYRDLAFKVDTARSDATNKPELDLSGGVINLGVKFSF